MCKVYKEKESTEPAFKGFSVVEEQNRREAAYDRVGIWMRQTRFNFLLHHLLAIEPLLSYLILWILNFQNLLNGDNSPPNF